MAVYLDIAASILIGSLLLLMIMSFNVEMVESGHINNLYAITQRNGFEFQEILRNDLKNIALNVPDTTVILEADSIQLKFKTDLGMDGSVDSVLYEFKKDDLASAGFTENPRDQMLIRRVNINNDETFPIGFINFRFTLYDVNGGETAVLDNIRQIGYSYYIESPFSYYGEFPGIYIQGRVYLKNLE